MKRPHRRIHFLIWIGIAPIVAICSIIAWKMKPDTPHTDLPPSINKISERGE